MGNKSEKQSTNFPRVRDPSYFNLEFWSQYIRLGRDGEGLLLRASFWKEVRGKSSKAKKLMDLGLSISTNPDKFKGKIPVATKEEEMGFKEGEKQ